MTNETWGDYSIRIGENLFDNVYCGSGKIAKGAETIHGGQGLGSQHGI